MPHTLSIADVQRIARLSRLELSDASAHEYRGQLDKILQHMDVLKSLDLTGIEPMTTPLDMGARLASDEPGRTLPTQTLLDLAPDSAPPFIRVPKVLGEPAGEA